MRAMSLAVHQRKLTGMAIRWLGMGFALLLSSGDARAALDVAARDDFWVPSGTVRTMMETNGVLYIGGLFDYISPVSDTGKAFDAASGATLPGFPAFSGNIKTILNDNAGGWFVGGFFTSVGGHPITNLAHIRADRMVDTQWAPNPENAVMALATDGVRLFVGGTFTNIGGVPRQLLAALDPATGVPIENWRADCTPSLLNPPPTVNGLAVSDGVLYVVGFFSFINGVDREHIGSVDAATGEPTSWFPNPYIASQSGTRIDTVAVLDGIVYVGGTFGVLGAFQTANPPVRRYIAALDPTKNLVDSLLPWNPDADGPVTSLAVSCDTVYVGGSFTRIGGQTRNRIAAIDRTTGLATSWNPNANADVLKVMLVGNTVYAAGKFSQIGGQSREFLAALDVANGAATLWRPRADFGGAGLALSGGTVICGGQLGPGGRLVKNVAAFNARTGQPVDWQPQVLGGTSVSGALQQGVNALAASGTTIYLGGPFTEVNGQVRNRLAAVDAMTGALVPAWNPNASGVVEALHLSGTTVYAGGRFNTVGGANRTNVVALDAVSGLATTWNPGADSKVTALLRSGDTVYVGGTFTRIGGQSRSRLAALDATSPSGAATAWNPNAGDLVSSIALLGSRLYVGGQFAAMGGQSRNRLAAFDLPSGGLSCWDPNPRLLSPTVERPAAANALLPAGDALHVGGAFNRVANEARYYLATVPTNCPAVPGTFNPILDGSVNALESLGENLYVGGAFQTVGGQYRPNLAVFPPVGSPRITLQPRNQLVALGANVVFEGGAGGTGTLAYQWQQNGTNLPGATSPVLNLSSVAVSRSGEYVLVVTNLLGLIRSRPATLTVFDPLVITSQPQSQTVAPGTTVTLSVGVLGNPPPVYQWRLNGVNIPGALGPTLSLPNAQPTNGGSYQVFVANLGGAVSSDIATVRVTSPALGFADTLAARGTLIGSSGQGSGNNASATIEAGEPPHVDNRGGHSVWVRWVAPGTGIATFSTRGSSFDTLLAVYVGTNLATLIPVASDDDHAGFYSSEASFNTISGVEYLIAVDGFGGAAGDIVLSWTLDTSAVEFPRITMQPVSLVRMRGQTAHFSVDVVSSTLAQYQWFFGCRAIAGATNSTLTLANIQFANVGNYRVLIANASSRLAESFEAALEIGPVPGALTRDKVDDSEPGAGGGGGIPGTGSGGSTPIISVSAGTIEAQLFNNAGAGTSLGEPNHCEVLGGASRYLDFRSAQDAVLVIDTMGSRIDTVLAVYFKTNLLNLSRNEVACDDNSAPDGIRSWVRFGAQAGRDYRVFVDGVNAAQGEIQLNWRMGYAPSFAPTSPFQLTNRLGGTFALVAPTNGSFTATQFQWYRNGIALTGANSQSLVFGQLTGSEGGTYSVVASNEFGATTKMVGTMTVMIPYLTIERRLANGGMRLWIQGPPNQDKVVQASSNLAHWTPIWTNVADSPVYRDFPRTGFPNRFYRTRPWP